MSDTKAYRWDGLDREIVRRGVKAVTGIDMPVFPKRRFQQGAATESDFSRLFPADAGEYRRRFVAEFAR